MVNKEPRAREVAQIRQLFVVQINQFCIGFFGYRNTMCTSVVDAILQMEKFKHTRCS